MTVELPPPLDTLSFLVGTWAGRGAGDYPTVHPFAYVEEITFGASGKPFLTYVQRTVSDDDERRPLHGETGFWRCPRPGAVEAVIAHPTGITEVAEGTVTHEGARTVLVLRTTAVGATASAKAVTAVERRLVHDDGTLAYELAMAAVGQPLVFHLRASLRRGTLADVLGGDRPPKRRGG